MEVSVQAYTNEMHGSIDIKLLDMYNSFLVKSYLEQQDWGQTNLGA